MDHGRRRARLDERERAELRELRRRGRTLEQEQEILNKRAAAF